MVCMFFLKRDITLQNSKNSSALGPNGPKHYIFGNHFYFKNVRKLIFHVFLNFCSRKHMTSSIYLTWIEFTRNFELFFPIVDPRGSELNWNKFTISCEFGLLQLKWCYHMLSGIKMEEYMESNLSGIFWVKLAATNIVLGSPGLILCIWELKAL